jgi:hypothetical protein
MKKKLVLVLVFVALIAGIYAEAFTDVTKAKKIIENAIDLFTNQKFEDGVNILKPYWPQDPASIDNLAAQAKQQWTFINENYGKKIEIEYIRTENIGKSLIKYIYIAKMEKYALRFETVLYHSVNGWMIISFSYDDKINELFLK